MALKKRRPGLVYPTHEDWHYVGDTGEPAFGTNWANAGLDRNLAFRIRETGIVDVQGSVENTNFPSAPATSTLFTLPVGYRPSATAFYTAEGLAGGDSVPINISVSSTTGGVVVTNATVDPFPGAGVADPIRYVRLAGQFFLTPSSAP